jgi:iron complex outermembrane recepter protein
MRTTTLRCAIGLVLAVAAGAPVQAQTTTANTSKQSEETLTEVIVTGVRESLRSAQQIKQDANQIVDSVQAQDIGKLPDVNTTEALQRITGVQIQRRYGEGATDFDHRTQPAVTVRGLTQVQNFLDGRAIYSASGGRAFDLEGVPPELLSGIDVYKNAPADIIEGGVGGAVNLRTRKPFDADGQVISATVRGNHYDRVDKDGGATSGLYSNRWDTSAGEMGFLVNAVVSKSYYRQDGLLAGPFDTVAPGSIANAPANAQVPYGFEIYDDSGDRKRLGISSAFQWKPNDDLLLTAQYQQTKYWFDRTGAYYYDFNNRSNARDSSGNVTSYGTDPLPGANFTFNDEGYATSGSLRNQTFETGRFDQELWSQSQNFTVNAEWQVNDRLKTNFDVQYLKSYYNADRNGHVLSLYTQSGQNGVTSPHHTVVDFDLRGKYPRWNVRDPQLLTDPANYTTPYIVDSLQRNDADTSAVSGDFEYSFDGGFFDKLRGGLRYSDSSIDLRGTWHGLCVTALGADPNCSAPAGTPLVPLSAHPELAMRGPSDHWFDGNTVTGGLLYPAFPSGGGVREQTKALFDLLGATMKDNFAPGDINSQTEETYTGWLVVDYETNVGGLPIDGGVGVRLVKTDATSSGTQFNPDDSIRTTPHNRSMSTTVTRGRCRASICARSSLTRCRLAWFSRRVSHGRTSTSSRPI